MKQYGTGLYIEQNQDINSVYQKEHYYHKILISFQPPVMAIYLVYGYCACNILPAQRAQIIYNSFCARQANAIMSTRNICPRSWCNQAHSTVSIAVSNIFMNWMLHLDLFIQWHLHSGDRWRIIDNLIIIIGSCLTSGNLTRGTSHGSNGLDLTQDLLQVSVDVGRPHVVWMVSPCSSPSTPAPTASSF